MALAVEGSVSLLEELRQELDITGTAQDAELQRKMDAALAKYQAVGFYLPGTHEVEVSGGVAALWLPHGSASVVAVEYEDGTAVDVTGLRLSTSGRLTWLGGGTFAYGPLFVTVTVGEIPAHHRAAIVADVAELWNRTQRAGGGARPSFGGDGFEPEIGRPVAQYPRIEALAGPAIG